MVKRLQEKDVIVGAAYRTSDAKGERHFVVKSMHSEQAYVRFDDGTHGYVAYSDMESGS